MQSDKKEAKEYIDLSEEASRRSDDKATSIARELENDDAGNAGITPPHDSDILGNNKFETSASDD